MKTNLFLLFIVSIASNFCYSNSPILVNESTIMLDLDQTKELYFSFAEGDEIIFEMEMVKGKHIKEVELIEMPAYSIFTEFKAQKINKKSIYIRNKGIYKFRFYSSSITRKVCKIKIYRIPASDLTKNFNTNWKWEIKRDTTYTAYQQDSLVGYKTIKYQETVRELKEKKIEEVLFLDRLEKVHSILNPNKSRTYLKVDLPQIVSSEFKEEKLITWSYWIGVGKESQEAYKRNAKMIGDMAKGLAKTYTSPLGAYAVGAVTDLIVANTGSDIEYFFVNDYQNVELFMNYQQFSLFDRGKVINSYGKKDRPNNGTFYICLYNDNDLTPVEVDVKVLVVKEIKIFENITYNRQKEEPQYVTLDKTRMNINETKVRVPVE
ncbi:hypothetical protein [Flavivirga sp. 57AJ16]|uniref:hypothetical protein n=1 Tax=Flavivirga sp. 57AJ16 TaxID=3025307 RepID=UPI002365502E|nr:hypothetical protein [Flavivirga sp. 57AJ16]MDD7887101.1 hypothetical protein [Flavivirga sp. 57AJ16]